MHHYLTRLKLNARETRAIDIRKLRDAQEPDFQGNVIPAGATDGSVLWNRVENVPAMGQLVVLKRNKGMASPYTCFMCNCGLSYLGLAVTPSSTNLLPNQTTQFTAMGLYRNCNGCILPCNRTDKADWGSSAPSVATVTNTQPKGIVRGITGGTAYIGASYTDLEIDDSWYPDYSCHYYPRYGFGSGRAYVTGVSGPQTVWWFNGETPSGYATTITLTAQPAPPGGTSYSWTLMAGTDKAVLQNQSGNTIQVRGNDRSTSLNDVTVRVSVATSGGTRFATHDLTVRGPKKLVALTPHFDDQPDANRGFATIARYRVEDNFSTTLPSNVPASEEWTTSEIWDPPYSSSNSTWARSDPNGAIVAPSLFQDLMAGPFLSGNPVPTPTAPSCSNTKIFHWGQAFRVGSTIPGLGARVQTNTQQFYIDHGRHLNIVSPTP